MTTIKANAFSSCTGLDTLIFGATPETVAVNAFAGGKWASKIEDFVVYVDGTPSEQLIAALNNYARCTYNIANLNGGEIAELNDGGFATLAERENLTFQGWFNASGEKVEELAYDGAVYTAKWQLPTHTVTFDAAGGTIDGKETVMVEVEEGQAVGTLPTATHEGYTFLGWFDGSDEFTTETPVTGDMTITARWAIKTYTVTIEGVEHEVEHGNALADILPENPTREGYTFLGWFNGEVEVDAETSVTGDMTVTPRWKIKTYTVTIENKKHEVEHGSTLADILPENPTREGYIFAGWFDGEVEVTAETSVTGDMTVTPRWEIKTYTVTIEDKKHEVKHGSRLADILPENPVRESYTFAGWFDGETEVTAETTVTEDMTVTARWTAIPATVTSYTLTIRYVDESGNTVASTYTRRLTSGSSYNVTSPAVEGMGPDQAVVSGRLTQNTTVTVTYTADTNIDEPDVPLAELPLPFEDVKNGDWYREAVAYVWSNDLMLGIGDKVFGVETNTSRGMMATMLYRLEKEPATVFKGIFNDVEDGKWFSQAITWASDNGVVQGYDDGRFGPDDDVTREQLVVMLYRYASMKGFNIDKRADLSAFADADKVSGYAKDAMSWAVAEGLVVGRDSNLAPDSLALRVEVAALFQRFVAHYMDAEDIV